MDPITAEFEVIILGGGIGGLSLLWELTENHTTSALLLRSTESGRYASQKNQHWLHSGAFYATFDRSPRQMHACINGSEMIRKFCQTHCPDALGRSGALFLFSKPEEAWAMIDDLKVAGIQAVPEDKNEIRNREPSINLDIARAGIFLPDDVTFDPEVIMATLQRLSESKGATIKGISGSFLDLNIEQNASGKWIVKDSGFAFSCRFLICACGLLNGDLINKLAKRPLPNWIDQTLIAQTNAQLCESLVCLNGRYVVTPLSTGVKFSVSHKSVARNTSEEPQISDELRNRIRSIIFPFFNVKSEQDPSFYICSRLQNSDDPFNLFYPAQQFGKRHFFWTQEAKNGLFTFYPGLFTTALSASLDFVTSKLRG